MTDVQKIILDIYKVTAAICQRNGIPHFAIGGTCIGAVRHGGFIPWDDDMDIAVPVEDFGKLLKCLRRELPDRYQVVTSFDRPLYFNLFIKVEDTETAFIEKVDLPYPEAYKGIFLDIMPLGGVPENGLRHRRFVLKVREYHMLSKVFRLPRARMNSPMAKTFWPLMQPVKHLTGDTLISRRWLALARSQPFRTSETVGYIWSHNIERRLFKRAWFDETVDLPFEDTTVPCPAGYDEYLTAHFGDYMKLPPADKQVSNHPGLVDTRTSYREYQSGKRPIYIAK